MSCEQRTQCPGCGLYTWVQGMGCACPWCDCYRQLVREEGKK